MKTQRTFSQEGTDRDSCWLINGQKNFAILQPSVITGIDVPLPIRLLVGYQPQDQGKGFGSTHIMASHGEWVKKVSPDGTVAALVHQKLSQSGEIHRSRKRGVNLALTLLPSTLMILQLVNWQSRSKKPYLSVVTLYPKDRFNAEDRIGRYIGVDSATIPLRNIG